MKKRIAILLAFICMLCMGISFSACKVTGTQFTDGDWYVESIYFGDQKYTLKNYEEFLPGTEYPLTYDLLTLHFAEGGEVELRLLHGKTLKGELTTYQMGKFNCAGNYQFTFTVDGRKFSGARVGAMMADPSVWIQEEGAEHAIWFGRRSDDSGVSYEGWLQMQKAYIGISPDFKLKNQEEMITVLPEYSFPFMEDTATFTVTIEEEGYLHIGLCTEKRVTSILQDGEEILETMMGIYGVPTYNQPYFWIYRTNQKLQPGTYTFTITRG